MAGGYRDESASQGWNAGYDRTEQMPPVPPARGPAPGPVLNVSRLWAGGVATGIVAALIGFVGLLIVRVLLQIPYLAPIGSEPVVPDAAEPAPRWPRPAWRTCCW